MGIDCAALGTILVYMKDGTRSELSHEDTVKYCTESLEKGVPIDEIIKEELFPEIKLLKLKF